MSTLSPTLDGQRTFILTIAGSVAMLYLLGMATTLTSASRPVPVPAEKTPPGVREAVIIPREQYDETDVQTVSVPAPVSDVKATPIAVKTGKTPVAVRAIALSSADARPTALLVRNAN